MTDRSFRWQLHAPTTLFAAVLLPCLLALGFWQLQRADEKAALERQYAARLQAPALTADALDAQTPTYTRARVRGAFDNAHSFLLDNRILQGRVGYEVLSPLQLSGGGVLWVNRGWIAGDPARRTLPSVPSVVQTVVVEGYLYRDGRDRIATRAPAAGAWPRVIAAVELPAMDQAVGLSTYPYVLRIEMQSPGALTPAWPVVTSSPAKHIAYAVQWFAMAAVLGLLWLWRSSNLHQLLRRLRTDS